MPEPTSTIIASEKDPSRGIFFQKLNILGKSQKKSETGVTKLSTALRAANKFSIFLSPFVNTRQAGHDPHTMTGPE